MMRKFLSAMTIALGLTAGAAQAAPIVFDFQNETNGTNGTYAPFSATQGGLTVTVTGGVYAFDTIVSTNLLPVTKADSGLGVGLGCLICNNQINGPADLLTLTFSQAVHFGAAFFRLVDGNDDFDLFIDGVLVASEVGISGNNPFDLTGFYGTSISFGADGVGPTDDFRLGSFTVAAVPLPAGGLLLIGGMGALVLLRRRRA